MKKTISTILFLLFSLAFISSAQDCKPPVKKRKDRLVYDLAGFISKPEAASLDAELKEFARSTGTQIVVLTINDFQGCDKATYAIELGHEWGVGQEDKDNGVVILIKPKKGSSRGEAFIATGYGMEGILPDATCWDIVNNEMIPKFKNGNNFGGLRAAVSVIKDISSGEYPASEYTPSKPFNIAPFLILAFFLISIVSSIFRSRRGRRRTLGGSTGFWTGMFLGSSMSSGSSWGNFSSGGGSFGGFGGGGFGGGGAGGSW
jgi:uncharacterized protein